MLTRLARAVVAWPLRSWWGVAFFAVLTLLWCCWCDGIL